ncbi:hypothetical protein LshimejAT787_1201020 [Lyophyllum shimeji]|uniref:Uncharacterized protein n=1 Tax=Lyophyllum shimeji TaxID=47721 RepID=A0A9P3URG7_LYOSH|nr:hypothetical protein LshimejAT787_1201020 [Lyophyllum shimeji]
MLGEMALAKEQGPRTEYPSAFPGVLLQAESVFHLWVGKGINEKRGLQLRQILIAPRHRGSWDESPLQEGRTLCVLDVLLRDASKNATGVGKTTLRRARPFRWRSGSNPRQGQTSAVSAPLAPDPTRLSCECRSASGAMRNEILQLRKPRTL